MTSQNVATLPPTAAALNPVLKELDVTVLVPVKDEAETVEALAARVARVLKSLGKTVEIIFVGYGSGDGTPGRIRTTRERTARVKLIRLRRSFGKAAALSAGFDHCRGHIVITMDGDLQDDPEGSSVPPVGRQPSVSGSSINT